MNTEPCNCQSQTSKQSVNERPRYYARQLITPDDMTLEQDYFRAKLRRHNRYLHGWGVVCGANVVAESAGKATKPWKVIVTPGYILSPYGDEIYISTEQCVDVRKKCSESQPTEDDYECLEARPPAPVTGGTLFIAIRYVEKKTRLIRVPLGGCGCEDNTCEYSRFSDEFEICVLDHCPDSHKNPPRPTNIRDLPAPECPECETEPWVVLSAFTVDEDGVVTLEQCDCRRHVNSFGNYWWACVEQSEESGPEKGRKIEKTEKPQPATPTPATPTPAPTPTPTPA
jgi:hypothetical protein